MKLFIKRVPDEEWVKRVLPVFTLLGHPLAVFDNAVLNGSWEEQFSASEYTRVSLAAVVVLIKYHPVPTSPAARDAKKNFEGAVKRYLNIMKDGRLTVDVDKAMEASARFARTAKFLEAHAGDEYIAPPPLQIPTGRMTPSSSLEDDDLVQAVRGIYSDSIIAAMVWLTALTLVWGGLSFTLPEGWWHIVLDIAMVLLLVLMGAQFRRMLEILGTPGWVAWVMTIMIWVVALWVRSFEIGVLTAIF